MGVSQAVELLRHTCPSGGAGGAVGLRSLQVVFALTADPAAVSRSLAAAVGTGTLGPEF